MVHLQEQSEATAVAAATVQGATAAVGEQAAATATAVNVAAASMFQLKVGLIAAGVAASLLAIILFKTSKAAQDFERQMAEIGTLLGKTREQMEPMGNEILALTAKYGMLSGVATKAAYDIISATVPETEAIGALALASKAAVAGVTTVADTARLGMHAMFAYKMEVQDLGHIYDILFAIVKRGITTMSELAYCFGRVMAPARAANVSMEQLGATFTALTKGGLSTEEATTALRQLLLSVAAPTGAAAKKLKELGGGAVFAAFQVGDLVKGFKLLSEQGEEVTMSLMRSIVPNIRAGVGGFILVGMLKKLSEDLYVMKHSAGSMNRAFLIMAGTFAYLKKRLQAILQVFRVAIGKEGIVILELFLKPLEAVSQALVILITKFPVLQKVLGYTVYGVLSLITVVGLAITVTALWSWKLKGLVVSLFAANGAAALVGGTLLKFLGPIFLLVGAIYLLKLAWDRNFGGIRTIVDEWGKKISPVIEMVLMLITHVRASLAEFEGEAALRFKNLKKTLKGMGLYETTRGIARGLYRVGMFLYGVGEGFKGFFELVFQVFGQMDRTVGWVVDKVEWLAVKLGLVSAKTQEIDVEKFRRLGKYLGVYVALFGSMLMVSALVKTVLITIGLTKFAIGGVSGAMGTLSSVVGGVSLATLGWIGLVALAIVGLGVEIYMLVKHWDMVKMAFKDAWNWMIDGLMGIKDKIVNFVKSLSTVSVVLLSVFLPFLAIPLLLIRHWEFAKKWFGAFFGWIADRASDVWGGLKAIFSFHFFGDVWTGLVEAASWAWDKIKAGAIWLWNALKPVGNLLWNTLALPFRAVYAVAKWTWELIKAGWDWLVNGSDANSEQFAKILMVPFEIVAIFANKAWELIKFGAEKLWDWFPTVISDSVSSIWDLLTSPFKDAYDYISNLFTKLMSTVKNLVKDPIEWVANKFYWLWDKISWLWGGKAPVPTAVGLTGVVSPAEIAPLPSAAIIPRAQKGAEIVKTGMLVGHEGETVVPEGIIPTPETPAEAYMKMLDILDKYQTIHPEKKEWVGAVIGDLQAYLDTLGDKLYKPMAPQFPPKLILSWTRREKDVKPLKPLEPFLPEEAREALAKAVYNVLVPSGYQVLIGGILQGVSELIRLTEIKPEVVPIPEVFNKPEAILLFRLQNLLGPPKPPRPGRTIESPLDWDEELFGMMGLPEWETSPGIEESLEQDYLEEMPTGGPGKEMGIDWRGLLERPTVQAAPEIHVHVPPQESAPVINNIKVYLDRREIAATIVEELVKDRDRSHNNW